MNKIKAPLSPGMEGPDVGDLQTALQLLLEGGKIKRDNPDERRALLADLQRESATQRYGDYTKKIVGIFQQENRLELIERGTVDQRTADALNELLRESGLLDPERPPAFQLVTGVVHREDGVSLQGALIRAAHVSGSRGIRLGEDSTDAQGQYTIRYDALPGVDAIHLKVSVIDENGRTTMSSTVIKNPKPVETIDLTVPIVTPAVDRQTIKGAILLEHGLPAEKLKLRLYRRDFGGKATKLDETTTVGAGRYAFSYDAGNRVASLEVRAVEPDGTEVPLTKPLNDLTVESHANLNILAPGSLQPLAPEYRRLSDDLTPHVGDDLRNLKEAKEDAQQQDLSILNRATGWDARLIALAAITERLAADPDVGLPSEALYGLLRAGLPSDKLLLAQVEPDVVEMAIKKVRDAGIVQFDDAGIAGLKTTFSTFAIKTKLAMPVPGSRSTYGQLLDASGVFANDASGKEAKEKFASVFLSHRGDGAQLWEQVRKVGLDGKQIGKLQLQGKLAFLAGNSEAMTTQLLEGRKLKDPVELAGQGFHSAAEWKREVFRKVLEREDVPQNPWANLNGGERKALEKKLEAVIPAIYAGGKVEARLDAYAEDMARKIRLSYPTQVLGHLMENDEHFKLSSGHDATVKLLKDATAQGFRLGETPVSMFLQSRPGLGEDLSEVDLHTATEQLKTMQRVYQITPCNEAMPVLQRMQVTSGFDVMAYREERFIAHFKAEYINMWEKSAPVGVPELIRRKAKQVDSVTCNLFAIAKKLDTAPPVMAISGTVDQQAKAKSALKSALKAYPTMESLFGSMDFCECEHCRSALSPAAYLVDLLQFIDTEPDVGGKPYDALTERRPDLPHIALTCENTNTALPYIDIVNEILEYYVANGNLAKETARDTGNATTAELLAEPQYVIREAYDDNALRGARYPLNLPFDLWLETVRRFCDYCETPLHRVLEVFRRQDHLFVSDQIFDRAAIFMESLGLSPAELAIFTDPDPLAKWHELYGFDSAAEATTKKTDATGQRIDLNSAKALSRRLGVTYKEIVEIVQTEIVNPELTKLSLLYGLGVSIHDVHFYFTYKHLLKQEPATLSPEGQKRRLEVKAFSERLEDLATTLTGGVESLEAAIEAIAFAHILVLADPDAGCNFDQTTLRYSDIAFQSPKLVMGNFGYNAGDWHVNEHPRFLADLTGNGRADIVGFYNDGVRVALGNGDGTFKTPVRAIENHFGYGDGAGSWRVEHHPRFLADLTGDGRADIVGFYNDGVWVALNNGDGTFRDPQKAVAAFGYGADVWNWRVEKHPRFLADLTGNGRADIVGFADRGVYVALNNDDGAGIFQTPKSLFTIS